MKVTVDIKMETRKIGIFSSKDLTVAYLTVELSEEEKHVIQDNKLESLVVADRPKLEHEFNSSEKYQAKHLSDFRRPSVDITLGDFIFQHTHEHFFDGIPQAQNFEVDVVKGFKSAKSRMTERIEAADLGPKTYEL